MIDGFILYCIISADFDCRLCSTGLWGAKTLRGLQLIFRGSKRTGLHPTKKSLSDGSRVSRSSAIACDWPPNGHAMRRAARDCDAKICLSFYHHHQHPLTHYRALSFHESSSQDSNVFFSRAGSRTPRWRPPVVSAARALGLAASACAVSNSSVICMYRMSLLQNSSCSMNVVRTKSIVAMHLY